MKLKKLTIHNIASIADAVVDFEQQPLSDAQLFIITGDTGAGKSTILDAICLALYRQTPRLDGGPASDKVGDCSVRDPRQLLRRGTGEGYCALEFEDANRLTYTAQWSVRRAHNKADGKLQAAEHTLTCHDSGDVVAKDTVNHIERLLGLTIKQFSHTALLAQDAFARFLTSNASEKSELLAQLTGTEYYAEIGKTIYLRTSEKQKAIESQMAAIKAIVVMDDAVVDEKRRQLEEVAHQVDGEEKAFKQLQGQVLWLEQQAHLTRLVEEKQGLDKQAQSALQQEDYRSGRQLIDLWDRTVQLRQHLAAARQNELQLAKTEQQKELLHQRFTALCSQTPMPLDLQQAEQQLNEAQLRSEALRKQLEQYDIEQITNGINACNKRLLDMAQSRDILRQRAEAEQRRLLVGQQVAAAAQALTAAQEAKTQAEARKEAAKSIGEQLLVTLRNELKQGDMCPLCGQTVMHDHGAEQVLNEVYRNAKEAYAKAVQHYNECLRAQAGLQAQWEQIVKSINDLNARPVVDCTEEAQRQVEQQLTLMKQRQQEADQIMKQWAQEQKNVEACQRRKELASKINTLREKLQQAADIYEWPIAPSSVTSMASSLEGQLGQLWIDINSNKQSRDILTAQMQAANRQAAEAQVALGVDMEQVKQLMQLTDSKVTATRQWVDRLQREAESARTVLNTVTQQWREHADQAPPLPEGCSLEGLRTEREAKQQQLNLLNQSKGALETTLQQDAEARRQRDRLSASVEAALEECRRWERLNHLFGDATGKKFLNIAQSFVLESLLVRANEFLAGISDRYTLHCQPGTLIVEVHDSRSNNVAGSSSTLSGGERFMASLALALALANLGDQGIDTLFIDEGFGHLDDEHIRSAISTLSQLSNTLRRRIGIISHVPQIEEIPAPKLHVSATGRGNSSCIEVCAR